MRHQQKVTNYAGRSVEATERKRQKERERYTRLKEQGLCVWCAKRPVWRLGAAKCRECQDREKEYRRRHFHDPETKKAWIQRHVQGNRKRQYGITPETYDKLLQQQNNGCAICGVTANENKQALAVDHNHATGKIRGLLCSEHNLGLGKFKDNIQHLRSAVDYLEAHSNV